MLFYACVTFKKRKKINWQRISCKNESLFSDFRNFISHIIPGEGNGNLLQYSCLGNPMDREAWWATVHRLTKNQIRLKRFSTHVQSWLHLWPQGWACDPDIKESSTLFQASRDGCTTRSVDIQLLYFGWVKNSAFYMWRTFLAASCKKLPNNNIYFIMLNTCFFLLLFSILENL